MNEDDQENDPAKAQWPMQEQQQPLPVARLKRLGRDLARLSWCSAGAATALTLAFFLTGIPDYSRWLMASLGGSTIFLFGLTRSAAAQPRALFGGHLGGALIGILCYGAFGDAVWVYALAVVLTLVFMLATRTVHPPAGANPLIMVHAHAGFIALWQPVALSVLALAVVAAIWSRVMRGTVHYPVKWLDPSPPSTFWGIWDD